MDTPKPTTQLPDQQNLPCPRCDSTNTKFCYYNNYNLSQPRHFCKSCRRYWTHGGTLRPVPVGGGTRNNKSVIHVKRKSPRVRPEPVSNNNIDPVISDMGSGPVVVDLNEAWWNGLTSGDGLFGPVGSYGPGILDWPMEAVCWPEEISILTSGNELK